MLRARVLVPLAIAASIACSGAGAPAGETGATGGDDAAREAPPARTAAISRQALEARAAAARTWLASILSSGASGSAASAESATALQRHLEDVVAELEQADPLLRSAAARIAVVDLTGRHAPRLAHVRGDEPVYPASVIKFVYLMAAYAWREQGRVEIDAELDAALDAMIRHSSNSATQTVFHRLTGTGPGPELEGAAYASFRRRRLAIDEWVAGFGIEGLHAVNPTYDGSGDLFGRDRQFLRDRSIPGNPLRTGSEYVNRNAMTASATARLLALLATDRALSRQDSHAVRERMKRDVREQPSLARRIAGGAAPIAGSSVFSKSGTWGPIYADAGIVQDADGRQFALAVFTESTPAYRGDAIARLTSRIAAHLFGIPGGTT